MNYQSSWGKDEQCKEKDGLALVWGWRKEDEECFCGEWEDINGDLNIWHRGGRRMEVGDEGEGEVERRS